MSEVINDQGAGDSQASRVLAIPCSPVTPAVARMSYELLIGRRYLRSGRGNRFISFISVISMIGVAIGVAVLIVVLSVMNGFEQELRGRILSLTAHATISGFGDGLPDWQTLLEKARQNPEIADAAPYIEDQVLLVAADKSSGASVYGHPARRGAQGRRYRRSDADGFFRCAHRRSVRHRAGR